MRKWWLPFLALTIAAAAGPASAVTVWRWVDQDGVVHYSDRPVEGADRIELSGAQTFPGNPAATIAARPGVSTEEEAPEQDVVAYRRFEIVSPAQQETLWNIGGTLTVTVQLEPALQPGHRLDVYLDGERRNLGATSTELSVPEVHRGVHTLQGVIVDQSGSEILRSLAVTFMVQQTSVQNPFNRTPPGRRN